MKYKLINKVTQEEHLCNKVTIDGFEYYVSNEKRIVGNYYIGKGFNSDNIFKWDYSQEKQYPNQNGKVIATNNSNIDIPKVVDEIERLAEKLRQTKYVDGSITTWTKNDWQSCWKEGFIEGYNKSQETQSFSHEDMIEFNKFSIGLLYRKINEITYYNYNAKWITFLERKQEYISNLKLDI